jgi:uncharacterized protein YkwD
VAQTAWGPLPFALWHTRVGEASSSATRDTTATVNANESVVIANAFAWVGALNRTRASRGTERVGSDPLLATLAQERAEQMARAGAVLHARGAGDDPRSRAERAGVATERLAENVVRARTLAEAFARLQQSPAHRAQREDAAMDAVGVGIARRDEVVYVVELLAQRPRLR